MNPAEAARLLANISLRDGRQITEAMAAAWAQDLHDVPIDVALRVLPDYYRAATRTTRNWIYAGDVLALVQEHYRSERRLVEQRARETARLNGGTAEDEHAAAVKALQQFNNGCPVPLALPAATTTAQNW